MSITNSLLHQVYLQFYGYIIQKVASSTQQPALLVITLGFEQLRKVNKYIYDRSFMIRTSVKSFALSPVLLVPSSAQVFLHHGFLFPIYLLSLGCTPFPTCIITSCQPHFVQFTLFKVETFMYWYLLGMPLSSFKLSAQFFPHFFICTAEK